MADIKLAIIGCGNPNRSDDGVGAQVISLLRGLGLPEHTTLYDAGTDGMGVMYSARGATHLIIVDARIPDGAPGAIYEVPGDILEAPREHSLNLHDFRWDHALFVGRKIYGDAFPASVKVFLVEAETLALGLGLSEAVASAADKVAKLIRDLAHTTERDWSLV